MSDAEKIVKLIQHQIRVNQNAIRVMSPEYIEGQKCIIAGLRTALEIAQDVGVNRKGGEQ